MLKRLIRLLMFKNKTDKREEIIENGFSRLIDEPVYKINQKIWIYKAHEDKIIEETIKHINIEIDIDQNGELTVKTFLFNMNEERYKEYEMDRIRYREYEDAFNFSYRRKSERNQAFLVIKRGYNCVSPSSSLYTCKEGNSLGIGDNLEVLSETIVQIFEEITTDNIEIFTCKEDAEIYRTEYLTKQFENKIKNN